MDQNLVVPRVRERKRLTSPGLLGKPIVLFLGLALLHGGTGRPLEWVKAQAPSREGLRSPGKKVSSAGLCGPRN